MHGRRKRSVGALLLILLVAPVLGACGGDDDGDGEESRAFCEARSDLEVRITEIESFELTSEVELPEARERVLALVEALRTMLDEAPEDIRDDADTMASGLDGIEQRITEASALELPEVVPTLLAEIGGAGSEEQADAVTAVNDYASRTCD